MDPDSPSPKRYVVPNARIPKVIGILNITFSSALLICGLCTIGYYAMIPYWSRAMEGIQKQVEEKEKSRRAAELDALADQEKAATTDEEKAAIASQRKEVESRPRPFVAGTMNLKTLGLEDPRLKTYVLVEFASGFLLNLLLLVSGIGLVMRRRWGITTGLWTAALKLLRLLLVYTYAAVVIGPLVSQGMAKAFMETLAQQQAAQGKPLPPGFTAEGLGQGYAIACAAGAVGMIVVGSIYPAISLWLLSRPSARAACLASGTETAAGQEETW